MDPMACLKKSYKKDGVTLRLGDLTKAQQAELVSILFTTDPKDREYVTRKFLASVMVNRQIEAGFIPDPEIKKIAGE